MYLQNKTKKICYTCKKSENLGPYLVTDGKYFL